MHKMLHFLDSWHRLYSSKLFIDAMPYRQSPAKPVQAAKPVPVSVYIIVMPCAMPGLSCYLLITIDYKTIPHCRMKAADKPVQAAKPAPVRVIVSLSCITSTNGTLLVLCLLCHDVVIAYDNIYMCISPPTSPCSPLLSQCLFVHHFSIHTSS
jgi:hypothetical protein